MKHSANFIDLSGKICGRLKVLKYAGKNKYGQSMWWCLCECGTKKCISGNDLTKTMSCGCYRESLRRRPRTALQLQALTLGGQSAFIHGHSACRVTNQGKGSPEYNSWQSMKQRCTNPNAPNWNLYGGRGICVCTRWLNSFVDFLKDMKRRPKGKTLDRANSNGHYIPSNARWATVKQQNNNLRRRGTTPPVISFVDVN